MGGSSTVRVSSTKIEAFKIQSSTYGAVMPLVYGTTKVSINLMWYGDFKSIAHTTTESSGGKGGGGVETQTTSYTYEAAGIFGVCEGPASGVQYVYVGKVKKAWADAGLVFFAGNTPQSIWSHLTTNHPSEAVPYSGMCYLASPNYKLNDNAQLDNHTIILSGQLSSSMLDEASVPQVTADVLSNKRYGAMFPSEYLGSTTQWATYCTALGLKFSPAITSQISASSFLKTVMQLTNSEIIWSEGLLKFVPYGDTPVTGNSTTYTPNNTPQYSLSDDDFLPINGETVVTTRKAQSDTYNHFRVEFLSKDKEYNIEVAEAKDQANIDLFGLRSADVLQAHWVTDPAVARLIAQHMLQRSLYVRNEYRFMLPINYSHLEPIVDFLVISDVARGLVNVPVRLTRYEESETGDITFYAEDAPPGISTAVRYPSSTGSGFAHDYNVDPGSVSPPLIFEPPVELAVGSTGLEAWVAVTGTSPYWGGCIVWASHDGTSYRQVGRIDGGARYGSLTAALGTSGNAAVSLQGNGGQLLSGSTLDAQRLSTLCMVRQNGTGGVPEYFAYETATLTGTNAYTLSGLVRKAYDSIGVTTQPLGAKFVRIDQAIFKGEQLDSSMIGKQLKFKFTSFNVYGGAMQDLAEVAEYAYTVTGEMVLLPPKNVSSFTVVTQPDGTRQFDWNWGAQIKPVDLKGYVVRYRQGTGPFTWDQMFPFATDDGFQTSSPVESNLLLAGAYVFAIKTIDTYNVLSTNPLFIYAELPDPRLGSALQFIDYQSLSWPNGVKTGCIVDTYEGQSVLRAVDSPTTWATAPGTWSAFTRWVWDPVTSFSYETPVIDFGVSVPVLPVASYTADGDVTFEVATSSNGTTWSAWSAVSGPVVTRYIKTRTTVSIPAGSSTGPGVTPVCILYKLVVTYIGKVTSETGNDINPASLTGVHRIGTGDIRLPVNKVWAYISRVTITIQNAASSITYTVLDKDGTNGPRVRFYNSSNTLVDPALIDFTVEGIAAS
jgi:hypothetical protein